MSTGHWGTTALPGSIRLHKRKVAVDWETLPLHPVVMADTQGTHTHIKALGVTDNTLVVGYGDWTKNLGPVKVIGYDLSSMQPVTLMTPPPELASEAWDRVKIIDGKAYLPHTDPTLNNQGAYTTNESGVWETVLVGVNPSMIHTFDVIKFKGRMLVCGSMGAGGSGTGCVYTETAPGSRTFTLALQGGSIADFARFYKFYLFNNGNEVRVQNSVGVLETFKSTDGLTWTLMPAEPLYAGNDAGGGWNATEVINVPHGYEESAGMPDALASHTHNNWIYVSGIGGVIKRALLPDATRLPAPGATPAVNLATNPRGFVPTSNNSSLYVVTAAQPITGSPHPLGLTTASKTVPVGAALGSAPVLASHYNLDGLGASATSRWGGVWVKSSTPASFSLYFTGNRAATEKFFSVPTADTWTWVTTKAAGTGHAILGVSKSNGNAASGDHAFVQGALASVEPVDRYFDGATPADLVYTYEWSGTPNASTSIRKVKWA